MRALKRGTWNDDRLDELSRRTDEGFKEVKGEIKEQARRTDAGFEEVKGEIKEVRGELHRLNNTLLLGSAGVVAAIIGSGILG